MKVLIVKGWMGFGDRLESLKMCVDYAIQYNRLLYVDWTDSIWSHGNESFYSYFAFINLPQITSLTEIPEDASVFPPFWKGKLDVPLTHEIVNTNSAELDVDVFNRKAYDEDVLVFSSIGRRNTYVASPFFTDRFRVTDVRIRTKVKQRQQKYQLSTKWGIHLRGSDRVSNLDFKVHRMRQLSIRMVSTGILGANSSIAVSDDAEYIKLWKSRFSDIPILTEKGAIGGTVGAHNKDTLPISKDELNVDMLSDFFTLSSCMKVISTSPDSRFTHEAVRLHSAVNLILG
jgi:hypothetical protein